MRFETLNPGGFLCVVSPWRRLLVAMFLTVWRVVFPCRRLRSALGPDDK